MMEDKKIFLGSSIKYVSKINNSKRQLKEKRERSIKNITEKKFLYILIVILCLIIIFLLYIIFFKKVKTNSSVYP
jgi:cell division protein FtsL